MILKIPNALICFALASGIAPLTSQETPTPLQAPLVQSVPDFCEWTETFLYDSGGESARTPEPGWIKSIQTKKTKDILSTSYTYLSGNVSLKWQVKRNVFLKTPGENHWALYPPGSLPSSMVSTSENRTLSGDLLEALMRASKGPETLPLPAGGFSGLEWITPAAFVGTAKENDREYLLFVHPFLRYQEGPKLDLVRRTTHYAIIDAITRLPSEERSQGRTRKIVFAKPPSEMLTPPADLVREFQEGQMEQEKARAMPPRGY